MKSERAAMLRTCGLSYYESRAVAVLFEGPAELRALSRRADIPFGKIYSVVQALSRRGIIATTSSRPKTAFLDPDRAVEAIIAAERERTEPAYAQLRSWAATAQRARAAQSSFFETGTSLEENRAIQLRSFREAEREVCQILNVHHKPHANRRSKRLWEEEIVRAIERGVRFRCIYPEDAALPSLLAGLPEDRFMVRRRTLDFARCDVIDARKVMTKLTHHDLTAFGGIVFFEDERFAKRLHEVFEQFWSEAESAKNT